MMNNSITEQSYWDRIYKAIPELIFDRSKILFTDLFNKYVKRGSECFEVGCYPGKYLIYLASEFDCKISGIDFTSEHSRMTTLMRKHGISPDSIYDQDFMTFQPKQTYDFVFSLGFIEHFGNYPEIIRKHIQLVRPGGILFVACPNFRGIQWGLRCLLDRENLTAHNIAAMNLNAWKHVLETNQMNLLEHRYYGTFRFWVSKMPESGYARWLTKKLLRLSKSQAIRRVNFPTPLASPFLISVSTKSNQ